MSCDVHFRVTHTLCTWDLRLTWTIVGCLDPLIQLMRHAAFRVYSDQTCQRQFGGVKHDALVLEHMLTYRSIHNVFCAVRLTLMRPVWIDPKCQDLSRSLEINVIIGYGFPTIFNIITLRCAIKYGQLSYSYLRVHTVHFAVANTQYTHVSLYRMDTSIKYINTTSMIIMMYRPISIDVVILANRRVDPVCIIYLNVYPTFDPDDIYYFKIYNKIQTVELHLSSTTNCVSIRDNHSSVYIFTNITYEHYY